MQIFNLNDSFIINSSIAFRKIEEEYFVVTPFDSKLHNLNEVGSFIFSFFENKKPVETKIILNSMIEEYEVDEQKGMQDIMDFINILVEKKILLFIEKNEKR